MTAFDLLYGGRPIRHKGCGGFVQRYVFVGGLGLACTHCPRQWLAGYFTKPYESMWPDHFEIQRPPVLGAITWALVYQDEGKKRFLKLVPADSQDSSDAALERYKYARFS